MSREERIETVLNYFRKTMPTTASELHYASTFQLLIAVALSAQCTDRRVNMVTPELFKRYPTAEALAKANLNDVRRLVASVSYPNVKASHIVGMARVIVDNYGGKVPDSREALMRLPGVGRKTANVVLSIAYGKPVMAVDTHVYRVSHRLALVDPSDNSPQKVEAALVSIIPQADIPNAHHWLLLHGRYMCRARNPFCAQCPFSSFCPSRTT